MLPGVLARARPVTSGTPNFKATGKCLSQKSIGSNAPNPGLHNTSPTNNLKPGKAATIPTNHES